MQCGVESNVRSAQRASGSRISPRSVLFHGVTLGETLDRQGCYLYLLGECSGWLRGELCLAAPSNEINCRVLPTTDLAVPKLHDADEGLPSALDRAAVGQLTLTAALDRLLSTEVEATDTRRLSERLWFGTHCTVFVEPGPVCATIRPVGERGEGPPAVAGVGTAGEDLPMARSSFRCAATVLPRIDRRSVHSSGHTVGQRADLND